MTTAHVLIAQLAADIEHLCGPALAGRLSGTRGARLAADFLGQRLSLIGVQADGDDGYRQPLKVPATRLLAAPQLAIGGRLLRHRRDYAEHAALSAPAQVQGRLRVLDAAALRAEDMPGAVLLIADTPDDLDLAATASAAAALGARALLVESGEPDWFYKTIHTGDGRLPILRLRRSLARELAELQEAEVRLDLPLSRQSLFCNNLLARLPGGGERDTLLLCAHYDHIGDDPGGERFPGAFDNASGVAIVLALARSLSALPHKLPFDVQFALLTGEESGLHGARHLLARTRRAPAAVINIDSIGSEAEPLILRLGHGRAGDWLAEQTAVLFPRHGIDTRWIPGRDDTRVFQAAGIPTLGLGQQPSRPGANPMHTPDDRPERLHLDALARVHDAVIDLVIHLARTRALQPEGAMS